MMQWCLIRGILSDLHSNDSQSKELISILCKEITKQSIIQLDTEKPREGNGGYDNNKEDSMTNSVDTETSFTTEDSPKCMLLFCSWIDRYCL